MLLIASKQQLVLNDVKEVGLFILPVLTKSQDQNLPLDSILIRLMGEKKKKELFKFKVH